MDLFSTPTCCARISAWLPSAVRSLPMATTYLWIQFTVVLYDDKGTA